jgi:hypothetical protein
MLNGQVNLRDAIRRQIDFEVGGKAYKLSQNPAVLIVRSVFTTHVLVLCAHVAINVVLEGGIWTSLVFSSITSLSQAPYSTLVSISSTTPESSSLVVLDRISTFPRWNTTKKPVFGTTSLTSLSLMSVCLMEQCGLQFSLRLFLPPSIWRKFYLSSENIHPGSTADGELCDLQARRR